MLKRIGIVAIVLLASIYIPILMMQILPLTVVLVCSMATLYVCGIPMDYAILLTWLVVSTLVALGIFYYLTHKTTVFHKK